MQSAQDWYLSTMGIVRYVPRDQYVPPVETEVVEQSEAPSVEPAKPSAGNTKVMDSLLASLDTATVSPAPVEEPEQAEETVVAEPAVTSAPLVEFNLACWQPSDDLLVISELTTGNAPAREESQLLANILRAIGRLPDAPLPSCEERLSSADILGTATVENAVTMVSMYVASRIQSRGVCWVLLMGQAACRYVESDAAQVGYQVGDKMQLSGGATGYVLPSLAELLENPALKKQVWQSIRHLGANLST